MGRSVGFVAALSERNGRHYDQSVDSPVCGVCAGTGVGNLCSVVGAVALARCSEIRGRVQTIQEAFLAAGELATMIRFDSI